MRKPRTGHRGRVFYASILSYLAILLIPAIMSFLVFGRASDALMGEAAKANQKLLTQMGSRLDRTLREAYQVYQLISYNPRVKSLIYDRGPISNDDYYRTYEIVNDFSVYESASPTINSFYVYLPNLDLVISQSGYFTSHNYYDSWLSRAFSSYDAWMATFPESGGISFRQARVENSNDTVSDSIAMYAPLPVEGQFTIPLAWSVIHMDKRAVDAILREVEWTPESLLVIYDANAGILASSGPVSPVQLAESQDQLLAVDRSDHISVGGRRYLAFVQPSAVRELKWSYISLVVADLYRDRFTSLSRFTIIAFVVCFVIGGLVIFWFASARYRPIHALLEILEPDADGSISLRSDEFAIMRRSLEARLREDALLKEELVRSQPLLTQRLLTQLLKGTTQYDEEVDVRLRRLGVDLGGTIQLLLVELDSHSDGDVRLPDLVQRHSDEAPWERVWVVDEIGGATGLLIRVSGGDDLRVFRFAASLREQIEAETDLPCAVGMSSAHASIDGLAPLYAEADAALQYRLVRGRSRPIRYADVQFTGRAYYYPLELEGRLMNAIQVGNYEGSAKILADIYAKNFEGSALSIEMAQCLMFDLTSTMMKTLNALEEASEDGAFWSRTKPVTRLSSCRSLEQLLAEMDDILEGVCDYVVEHRTPHAAQLRDEVIRFIETHYTDPNLSADMVADHVGRNTAYLSRFFREEMSIGISSYIKRLRIDAAKNLLLQTSETVREIAERVGFGDSNALIRAFKDAEGVTPGEYRSGRNSTTISGRL